MSIELLQNLSLASYVLAGIFLFISVILFFRLDIITVIGDFTGTNQKKAIENIRQQNESGGESSYKSMRTSTPSQSRLTDKISSSGRLIHNTGGFSASPGTEKFSTVELATDAAETSVLTLGGSETTVLSSGMNETTVLSPGMNETMVLLPGMNETTVLSQIPMNFGVTSELTQADPALEAVVPVILPGSFTLEVEMNFLGSAELIE